MAVPRRAVSCRAEGEGEAKKAAKKKAEKPQVGPKKNAVVRDCCDCSVPLGAGCAVQPSVLTSPDLLPQLLE